MNLEIILVGIIVGIANFASRFGPFFVIQKLQATNKDVAQSG
jgi:branched-subunit amino acid transport protein AzlD